MNELKLVVKTNNKNYPIIIGENILKKSGNYIKNQIPNCKKIALIVDNKIPKKIVKQIKYSLRNFDILYIGINVTEKTKNINTVNKLIVKLLKKNFHRNDCIIALGGGVLGDLSGLTASLVKRGIKFVNIPTTLLSQVDASVGGKTGVNSQFGKNLIGTFYQPDLVLTDITTLKSLTKREIICGYSEILKHSLILNKKFFFWLQKNGKNILNLNNKYIIQRAIYNSCKIKAEIIKKDEKENNLRKILNFGHTFGHALEASKNFSNKINHGEAVLIGMNCANEFSFLNKILKKKDFELINNHYSELNLPKKIGDYFKKKDLRNLVKFMKADKKNIDSKINLILISKIGKTLKPKNFGEFTIKKYLNSKLY